MTDSGDLQLVCKYSIATGFVTGLGIAASFTTDIANAVTSDISKVISNNIAKAIVNVCKLIYHSGIIANFWKALVPWVPANAVPLLIGAALGAGVTLVVVGGIIYFYKCNT